MSSEQITITNPCTSLLHDHRVPHNDSQAQPIVEYRESSKIASTRRMGLLLREIIDVLYRILLLVFSVVSTNQLMITLSKQNC